MARPDAVWDVIGDIGTLQTQLVSGFVVADSGSRVAWTADRQLHEMTATLDGLSSTT